MIKQKTEVVKIKTTSVLPILKNYIQLIVVQKIGGNVWESNPPKRLLTPHTSFED